MNKTYTLLSIFALAVVVVLTPKAVVWATVGGPTYISSIAFKAQENSVYYTVHDNGGRGCPPIIHRISLTTLADSEVKSCTQVEQEFLNGGYEEGMQKYDQFISDTYQNLSYLGSVSLKKNNIEVRAEFLSEHIENGEKFWADFRASILQDNKEVAKLDFRGCSKDQPNIFEGYRIPNTDAMAILLSNKGDCFEGGYVDENLYVVKGVKYYDTTVARSIKENSATEPNVGNAIVYAGSKEEKTDDVANDGKATSTPSIPEEHSNIRVVVLVLALLGGTTLGYVLGKKFSKRRYDGARPR